MELVSYVIDANCILPFDACLFRYQGREFAFYAGTEEACYSVETIVEEPSQFEGAYACLQRFLNGFGWDNHCAFQILGVNSMGLAERVDLPRAVPLSQYSRRSRSLLVGFGGLSEPPSREAEIALSLLSEARMTENPFYEFLCLWKVMEIRYSGRATRDAEAWVNELLTAKGNVYICEEIREMQLQRRDVGRYYGDQCRNAIAHIERPPVLVADSFRDVSRVRRACCAIAPLAEYFIRHELHMPAHSTGIEVVRRTGERLPPGGGGTA